jgi:hypothetical protein
MDDFILSNNMFEKLSNFVQVTNFMTSASSIINNLSLDLNQISNHINITFRIIDLFPNGGSSNFIMGLSSDYDPVGILQGYIGNHWSTNAPGTLIETITNNINITFFYNGQLLLNCPRIMICDCVRCDKINTIPGTGSPIAYYAESNSTCQQKYLNILADSYLTSTTYCSRVLSE